MKILSAVSESCHTGGPMDEAILKPQQFRAFFPLPRLLPTLLERVLGKKRTCLPTASSNFLAALQDLRFQQLRRWGLWSSGLLRWVSGLLIINVSKEHTASIFNGLAVLAEIRLSHKNSPTPSTLFNKPTDFMHSSVKQHVSHVSVYILCTNM